MSVLKYLSDKKAVIIVFVLIMTFVDAVFYLDPKTSVSESNILYVNLFALLILFIYLMLNYLRINSMLKRIRDQEETLFRNLSEWMDYEHTLYFALLKEAYEKIENEKTILKQEKKEYSEFIEKWVHEIKTPISVVNLIVEQEHSIPDEIKKSLGEEMVKITDNVERSLYFSKLDSFNQDYFIEKTDVYSVVKSVIRSTAKLFIGKKIAVEIAEKKLSIHTDKKWLRFIVYQVITNSLKYTPNGGIVSITDRETPDSYILSITDTGCGIKSEDIDRIFNKGFTGYNGRETQNSTGLGLYISNKLAEKLNIKLTAESEWGRHTTLHLTFRKEHDYFKVTEM